MGRNIFAFVKNPGGANAVIPILPALEKLGFFVRLFGSGPSAQSIAFEVISGDEVSSAEALVKNLSNLPDLVITSMCTEGGPGRDIIPIVRKAGGIPVIAVQDYWGGELAASWSDPVFRPDAILVNDELGKDIVLQTWQEFPEDKIYITGYPALHKFEGRNVGGKEKEIFFVQLHELSKGNPVLFFAGQNQRSGQALTDLVRVLNTLPIRPTLIVKQHPRMKASAPEEIPQWEQALSSYAGPQLDPPEDLTTEQLVAGADLTVSMYSTVLITAAALCRPAIAMLYPDVGAQRFQEAFGGAMEQFPLVTLGCCHLATDDAALQSHIEEELFASKSKPSVLLPHQVKHFKPGRRTIDRAVNAIINHFPF